MTTDADRCGHVAPPDTARRGASPAETAGQRVNRPVEGVSDPDGSVLTDASAADFAAARLDLGFLANRLHVRIVRSTLARLVALVRADEEPDSTRVRSPALRVRPDAHEAAEADLGATHVNRRRVERGAAATVTDHADREDLARIAEGWAVPEVTLRRWRPRS